LHLKMRRGGHIYGSSRAVAVALLCFLVHALLVSAIHHHRLDSESALCLIASDAHQGGAPGSSVHSECLSCRLQQNFFPNVQPNPLLLELPPGAIIGQRFLSEPRSREPFSAIFYRAPPNLDLVGY
jgi:hypothetical protein